VYNPCAGDNPLAIAKAIAKGSETILTVKPEIQSRRKLLKEYP
jgi:hypothetical protein